MHPTGGPAMTKQSAVFAVAALFYHQRRHHRSAQDAVRQISLPRPIPLPRLRPRIIRVLEHRIGRRRRPCRRPTRQTGRPLVRAEPTS